jgi:TonB family protein
LGAGFASGLLVYASVFVVVSLVSLLNISMPESGVVAISDPYPLNEVRLLLPTTPTKTEKNQAKSGAGSLGGSLSQPQRPHGGGGANDLRRTSKGVPPPPSSPVPPVIEYSTLIIKPTVNVDPKSLPIMKGQIGILDSPPDAPPSRGSGSGSGIGSGKGPGYREGEGGNVGGHKNRDGGGTYSGCCDGIPVMGPELRPTILYREKAKYTEEARQHKVEGTVVLTVVFGADGRIQDIRTVRGLPEGLTETSIEAAQKIRFHPAILNGKPVSVRATLEFSFALY